MNFTIKFIDGGGGGGGGGLYVTIVDQFSAVIR